MVTDTSTRPAAVRRSPTRAGTAPPGWLPGALVALACLGLAVISVHTLPSVPDYDEFSWIVWGRELAHQVIGAHQMFNLNGGPSWKPFPMLFTTIFGAFASAVSLWVVFVRAIGLFALWLAFRAGARLGASERWPGAAPVAGVLSAVAICLTLQWFHFMFRATSEPLTITATLVWVERMVAGRRLQALLGGIALATMRPEAGFFVAVYGLWLLWREDELRRRALAAGGVLLVIAAWIVPPWIAEGQPLQASTRARAYQGNQGHQVATFVLQRADTLVLAPVLVLAAIALALALWRRERAIIGLAVASLAYVGVIELMALHGFPGLPRFMLPAAAVVSVLAAVAVARIGALLGGGVAAAAVVVVVVTAAVPFTPDRASQISREFARARVAMHYDDALITAVRRAGGRAGVLPCGSSKAAVDHVVGPSLAYDLGVALPRVRLLTTRPSSLKGPSVAFLAHGNAIVGRPPKALRAGLAARQRFRVRMWHVFRITRPGDLRANACVGARGRTGAGHRAGGGGLVGGAPGVRGRGGRHAHPHPVTPPAGRTHHGRGHRRAGPGHHGEHHRRDTRRRGRHRRAGGAHHGRRRHARARGHAARHRTHRRR